MIEQEVVTIGLTQEADDMLEAMVDDGTFAQKVDGYRFAFSLALAQGAQPGELSKRKTIFNVGTVDPDNTLQDIIEELAPELLTKSSPYRAIERLAEWGVRELYQQAIGPGIDFVGLLTEVEEVNGE
ncbi:hypothetical protein ACSSNL_01435 [Thalassobius sp. S69A]|uniref:hypothetical protein n=1 Tax=unclassified Thalassovita TaxID=2619711 RepID=UPI003C7ABB5D